MAANNNTGCAGASRKGFDSLCPSNFKQQHKITKVMAIIKKSEVFPKRPVIIVIYGTPGVGKTSLFNTSKNPILLDCDRGADRAVNREDAIIASNWKEVLQDESEIKNYSTLGIDTAKAVLDDFLMAHVVEQDYKLKTNKLKAFGAIGDEFKLFINKRRSEGIDMVIIAHAKEDKDGDVIKYSPDVTGQSKDLLLRIADQVGFMTMVNNKRTITFEPTDRTVGKNVAKLPTMEIPDEKNPSFLNFMDVIISKTKSAIQEQTEAQRLALEKIKEIEFSIENMETVENADAIWEEMRHLTKSQIAGIQPLFKKKCESLKIVYNQTNKKFEYVQSAGNPT